MLGIAIGHPLDTIKVRESDFIVNLGPHSDESQVDHNDMHPGNHGKRRGKSMIEVNVALVSRVSEGYDVSYHRSYSIFSFVSNPFHLGKA